MNIDITEIVVAIIGLLGVVVTGWLIPYLKSKTTNENWNTILLWTKTFVEAAEVLFDGAGRGHEKRAYVISKIKEKCKENKITFDELAVRAALESQWMTMENSLYSRSI